MCSRDACNAVAGSPALSMLRVCFEQDLEVTVQLTEGALQLSSSAEQLRDDKSRYKLVPWLCESLVLDKRAHVFSFLLTMQH